MKGTWLRIVVPLALGVAFAAQAPGSAASSPPQTIPAVREWKPRPGPDFRLTKRSRIVLGRGSSSLRTTARVLARDLERQQGTRPSIVAARQHALRPGDIRLNENRKRAGMVGRQGYRLAIGKAARIKGGGGDGAFYGTRTLLQLLAGSRALERGVITEAPRWPERGLMVDAGRKYFTPRWLAQTLHELAWLKLDFIHLHLSDKEGFRIESDSHPEAVSERHLTKKQIRRIIRIAARLRIDVIPEIDMPGHMTAALAEHPELQLENAAGQKQPDKLDITSPAARRFALDLVREYVRLFPGRVWHMGADEFLGIVPVPEDAPNPVYLQYPKLGAYATAHYGPGANPHDTVDGFIERVRRVVERHGKTLRIWHDGLDLRRPGAVSVDPSVEVEWWIDLTGPSPREVVDAGHRILNSGWFPTYYVQGPLASVRPNMEAAYEGWSPKLFFGPLVCDGTLSEPADTLAAEQRALRGTALNIWNDDPEAQTEEEIARDVAMRLRVIAQAGWGSPAPTADYQGFLELADRIGHAPGYDEVTTAPSATDGRDCSD